MELLSELLKFILEFFIFEKEWMFDERFHKFVLDFIGLCEGILHLMEFFGYFRVDDFSSMVGFF